MPMNYEELRLTLRPLIEGLSQLWTHKDLPDLCQQVGLRSLSAEGSKRERVCGSFDSMPDDALPMIAERLLKLHPPGPEARNAIQEILWEAVPCPAIPIRTRREIAQSLEIEALFRNSAEFDALLDGLWVLDDDPLSGLFGGADRSLRGRIEQHLHRNPGDWSVEEFFNELGAFKASDARYAKFLQGLTTHQVQQEEGRQRHFVECANIHLRRCGCEFRETDADGGYPVFTLVSTKPGAGSRPKNLIFASSVKPDLRLRDAVNNDVEIVTNADKVLVYDRPIGGEGLRWSDLQAWWSEECHIPNDDEAKKSLWRRLQQCLPPSSPPQRRVFDSFYRSFGDAIPRLPALLPEVWLHWDPKTVRERGANALFRFRMDFLMLLPGGHRVVIEVDGNHHYATSVGRADSELYGSMVAADRELKLAGYEVFRFGAAELQKENAEKLVQSFFVELLKKFSVRY